MQWCGLVAGGMMQYLPMITPGICLGRIAEQQPTICPEYPSVHSTQYTVQYSTAQYSVQTDADSLKSCLTPAFSPCCMTDQLQLPAAGH